jgi:hypothetical protein
MNVPTSKERSCRAVARGRDYYFILTCIVIALPEVPHTLTGCNGSDSPLKVWPLRQLGGLFGSRAWAADYV